MYRKQREDPVERAKLAEYNREWRRKNKERWAAYKRNDAYQRKYGITAAEFDLQVAAVKSICAICNEKKRLVQDHDHYSGKRRGLLCHKCNGALGHIENREWVKMAEKYLGGWSSTSHVA